jgi:site-specific recombinase XerD
MKTNFSMLFYLKKQKNYTSGTAPIYLRITVDGQRSEVTTNRECEPSRWNSHAGRAIGTKESTRSLNTYLDDLQSEAYEAHRYLHANDKTITAESIKNKMLGKSEKAYMLIEIFQEHNRKVESLVGVEFATQTYKRYQISLQHTKAFLLYKYKVRDIDITKIGTEFISEYDYYLRSVRKCNNNSTIKYIKNFGKIIRICLSNGWIIRNPFLNYKGRIKPVNPIHLTQQELQVLEDKNFAIDRLSQVRDVFLFCCFTGLAYVDIKKLKASEITKGIDGEQWIFTHRQKTKIRSAIPILPTAAKLIEKYKDHPLCVNKDVLLPVPSNQKMNGYLKEIADLCGISKAFTSHIARHTFATTITLGNGVPIETVSKMLGHSSIRQTQHYAKVLDLKVSADMLLLKQKLELSNGQ